MAKRFTETLKWADQWFRKLTPTQKLVWGYLCDNCDAAGVIDLDHELAEFQIGQPVEWEAFFKAAGERVRVLPRGKIWITGFVRFQYGELTDTNNLHRSVRGLLERHGLSAGDAQGVAVPSAGDKVKVKEEVKVNPEGGCKGETKPAEPARIVPELICHSKRLAETASKWLAYKAERREAYKPTGLQAFLSRLETVASIAGPQSVIAKLERAMASGWKGWEHDEPGAPRGSPRASSNASKGSHVYDPELVTKNAI